MNASKSPKTILEFLIKQSKLRPNKIAIIDDKETITYGQLMIKAYEFSVFLYKLGIRKGERVLILANNSISTVIAMFGCLYEGIVFVPIHPKTGFEKIMYIKENCDASIMLYDDLEENVHWYNAFPKGIFSIKNVIFDFMENKIRTINNNLVPSDTAFLIYTSGTTGYAKGVIEAHESVVFAVNAINKVLNNSYEDIILCGLPLSFDYGLYQIFLACSVGAQVVLMSDFSLPLTIPKILNEMNITGFPLVPSIATLLIHSGLLTRVSLPKLRYITSTGDVFPPKYIEYLKELLPKTKIFPMYGLTECKRVSILKPEEWQCYPNSVGRALDGTLAEIWDTKGKKLSSGNVGELVVSGPHVMKGYWNAEEETVARFQLDLNSNQVWLHTNDLFYMNEKGYLFYVARNELVFKTQGHRISAVEIERTISEIDGIIEVAAIAIDDSFKGQKIALMISCTSEEKVTKKQIIDVFGKYFLIELSPELICIDTKPLIKSFNGKIDREKIKKQLIKEINGEISCTLET